jgi:hypothetical protein
VADLIKEIEKVSGNDQVAVIAAKRPEIVAAIEGWAGIATKIEHKLHAWNLTQELLAYAKPLPQFPEWDAERDAILSQRALLATPDPVSLLNAKLDAALRTGINQAAKDYEGAYTRELQALEDSADWTKLTPAQRQGLLVAAGMRESYAVDTSSTEAIVKELKSCDLSWWEARIEALTGKFASLRTEAAKLIQPKAVLVKLPGGVLQDEAAVHAWVAAIEAKLLEAVKTSPVRV